MDEREIRDLDTIEELIPDPVPAEWEHQVEPPDMSPPVPPPPDEEPTRLRRRR